MDPIAFLIVIAFAWISLNTISRVNWFDIKNPEIGLGYAFYRTTRLNHFINRLASKGQIIWKFFWDIGVISGLGILFVGLAIFTINIPLFFLPSSDGTTNAIALTPVIPGITISLQTLPYFIIAIMIGAVVHEFAHGIAARVENVDLKNTGIFIFLVLFGAFVEPDEKSFNDKSRRSKIRIMAAGALANMLVAGICIIVLIIPIGFPLLISPLYHTEPSGVLIIETVPNSPASQAGIEQGFVITKITINNTDYFINSSSDMPEYSNNSMLAIYFEEERDPILLQTAPHPDDPNKGFIGIRSWSYYKPYLLQDFLIMKFIPYWIFNMILYVFMINFMVAIMNLLPVPFLDGDKLLADFLGPKFRNYLPWIRYFALIVLGTNLILSFVITGWKPL